MSVWLNRFKSCIFSNIQKSAIKEEYFQESIMMTNGRTDKPQFQSFSYTNKFLQAPLKVYNNLKLLILFANPNSANNTDNRPKQTQTHTMAFSQMSIFVSCLCVALVASKSEVKETSNMLRASALVQNPQQEI